VFGFELGFGEKIGPISSPMCNWIDIVQFWEFENTCNARAEIIGFGNRKKKRLFYNFYFVFA
jgi:hypothetical protein